MMMLPEKEYTMNDPNIMCRYPGKNPPSESHRSSKCTTCVIALTVLSIFVTINIYTIVKQHEQISRISLLEERIRILEDLGETTDSINRFQVINERKRTANVNHGEAWDIVSESHGVNGESRLRRNAPNENDEHRPKKKKNKKSKISKTGVHFSAHIDTDRINRELAEGRTPSIGNMTEFGLKPHGQIYNIWKEEPWSNKRHFHYNPATGKVRVKSSGTYLIYGQIMFHSPAARKAYGIHINDETVPFIESLAFDNIHHLRHADQRQKRSIQPHDPDYHDQDEIAQQPTRKRRSAYSSYSQCNTLAVTFLKKNDEIFLKSIDVTRTLVAQKYLTFWGMAKL